MFESILGLVGKARGGVRCHQIEIVEANATESMPDHYNSFWADDITTSSDFSTHKARKDTIHFTEDRVVIDGAEYYKSQMKITFSKDSYDLIIKLRKLSRKGAMIRWYDTNGNIKLMGTSDNPCRFTWGRDNKPSILQANVLEGVFTCVSRLPVLGYPTAAG